MRKVLAVPAAVLAWAATSAADAPIGRLPTDVVPVSESIVLDLDPRQPTYTGSVEITIDVRKAVTSVRFHAESIPVRKIELRRPGSDAPPAELSGAALPDGQFEARAATPIAAGRYVLKVDFDNAFDTEARGLYRLKFDGEWYAFTQFEAIDARRAFPCWDEPSFKIPYRFTLTVPAAEMAIANTKEATSTERDGRRTVAFAATRPLPAYLLAVAVGPFETVEIPGTSIPARIVTPKGQSGMAGTAVAMTPPILQAIERWFGGRYPYDKLDLIAVPEYWYGAMENPGAITFLDRVLLMDPKTVDVGQREHFAVDTAHEIAHMWFGDLVTMAWWDDLWLNESFASWMEDKITAEVFPEFESSAGEVASAQRVMGLDSQLTTRAMRQPVRSMDSLLQSADALAYAKGSAVLHMVESWVGPEEFRRGVITYLDAHADGNAVGRDLWTALGAASARDVEATLSSYLDQPGVPLVIVEPQGGGRVRLSQTRFVNADAKPAKSQLWQVPVILRYLDGDTAVDQRVLLTKASQVVALETKGAPSWIYPNSGEIGYYRWSLPEESFDRLAAAAPAVLEKRERIGFLGNAAALLSAGRLRGAQYVKVLQKFASDPDAQVVQGVVRGLEKIRGTFFVGAREAEFAPFVRRVLRPALERIGETPRAGEPDPVTALRPQLLEFLGDAGHDEAVLTLAERWAASSTADPSSVDPSLLDVAIKLSAIRGDAALFDRYRARFESAKVPAERRRYLSALGNFRDPALAERAMAYALSGPLRPQEVLTIPRMHADVPGSRARTLAWVTGHYAEIAKRIPSDFMVFLPHIAGGCSLEDGREAKAFFSAPEHSPPGTSTELARVEESIGACVGLDAREGASVRGAVMSTP